MSSFGGSLARMLAFGNGPACSASAALERAVSRSFSPDPADPEHGRPGTRCISGSHVPSWAVRCPACRAAPATLAEAVPPGPEKYRTLEQRRRHAQIKARHLLDLLE